VFSISEILHTFDRKERAWVVRNALGCMAPQLAPALLKSVSDKLILEPPLRADSWWGVDFHLDWLAAALHVFRLNASPDKVQLPQLNDMGLVVGGIEDIDFVIADANRVIFIEAKAFGHWDDKQLNSKVPRLANLIGDDNGVVHDAKGVHSVRVYFMLMSMRHPPVERVYKNRGWPSWTLPLPGGKPAWIKLETSHKDTVKRPMRCDEHGKPSVTGKYWKIEVERIPESD
jgi:hypothetical protein